MRYIEMTRRGLRRLVYLALPLFFLLAAAGCDDLLEVPDPDVATEEAAQQEAALDALVAGAIGDFQVGYSGTGGIALYSGLLADEYQLSGTFPTRLQMDQRNVLKDNATLEGFFRNMHVARAATERAVSALEDAGRGGEELGVMNALSGFMTTYFGESFCSGVPFSILPLGGSPQFGEGLSTAQMFQRAIGFFDAALAAAPAGSDAAHLAAVGKGRALLNLDDADAAAAAVANVPTSFEFLLDHSANSGRQNNGIFVFVNDVERWRVADQEGVNGLPYRSANDPRVPWELDPTDGVGFDQVTTQYNQLKYPDRASDIAVADGTEARLIEAEAALRNGNVAVYLALLNELRLAAGMDPVTDPGTQAGRVDLLMQERAFWMWQTAHRLGDLRRLVRQYGRDTEAVFPTGEYFKGGDYGPDVNYPIPTDEENNPNFVECIDRGA